MLGAPGESAHLIGHHGKTAPLFTGARGFDGRVKRQQVGLFGNALDHVQYAADGLAVDGQLVDNPHRLIDLRSQAHDATLLGLHQRTPADGFIVNALGAADCGRCATGHFLGGGGHLIHRRRHLFDLAALAGHRLVTLGRNRLHLAGLQFDLADRMPDTLDQVMDLGHGAIEHLAQVPKLIAALGNEGNRHVTCRHFVHHRPQAMQSGACGNKEARIQIENQREHRRQGRDQQHHVHAVLCQPLLQLLLEERQSGVIQLIRLGHQLADAVVKALPRHVEGLCHHHLFFEQLTALLQAGLAGLRQRVECCVRGVADAQRILQLQAIFALKLFQLLQQLIKACAGRRIDETLAQRIRAHRPALSQRLGDLRGDGGDQIGELAQLTLRVTAQAGLAGNDLAKHLGLVE